MGHETLIRGYKHVVDTIYAPKPYYERIRTLLREYKPGNTKRIKISLLHLLALLRSTWVLGVQERGRVHYWKLFVWTLLRKPRTFPLSMTLAVQGFHFRKVAARIRAPFTDDVPDWSKQRS